MICHERILPTLCSLRHAWVLDTYVIGQAHNPQVELENPHSSESHARQVRHVADHGHDVSAKQLDRLLRFRKLIPSCGPPVPKCQEQPVLVRSLDRRQRLAR
jgi:hypothetical protein